MVITHNKVIEGSAYFRSGVYGRYNRAFALWSLFYPLKRVSYVWLTPLVSRLTASMWAIMPIFLVFETSVTPSFAALVSEEVLNQKLTLLNWRPGRDLDRGLDTLTIRIYTR